MLGWSGNVRGIMVVKFIVTQALKATVKKADKAAAKAIKEASTPGKKIKGWSKIAAPGIPFHIKQLMEGKDK